MDVVGKIRKNVRSPVMRQWRSLDGCAVGASWNTQDFMTLNSALKNPNSGHAKTEHCDPMSNLLSCMGCCGATIPDQC